MGYAVFVIRPLLVCEKQSTSIPSWSCIKMIIRHFYVEVRIYYFPHPHTLNRICEEDDERGKRR